MTVQSSYIASANTASGQGHPGRRALESAHLCAKACEAAQGRGGAIIGNSTIAPKQVLLNSWEGHK